MSKNTKKRTMIYSNVKENKKRAEEISRIKDDQINLNDEVFIGLSKGSPSNEPNENSVKKQTKKKANTKNTKNINKKSKKKVNKKVWGILKVFVVLALCAGILVFVFSTATFNIKEIVVTIDNNNILTEQEIVELSNINIGENIFSISKRKAKENIKTNQYVDTVKIRRSLPNQLIIEVSERSVRFQLENGASYIDIDNQGYILDEVEEKADVILVSGYSTQNLTYGNRLDDDDLEKLSDVMQIMQEINNNQLGDIVTKIDISDKNNYKLYFDSEGKVAYIGDINLINDKIAYVKKIIESESGYEGEIFVNVDLNNGEYPFFREKV